MSGTLLVFCINQGISASFSLVYFLIIDSGPPGSGPLKDLNNPPQFCYFFNFEIILVYRETAKEKKMKVLATQLCLTLLTP